MGLNIFTGTWIIISIIATGITDLFRLVESIRKNTISSFAVMLCTIREDMKLRAGGTSKPNERLGATWNFRWRRDGWVP